MGEGTARACAASASSSERPKGHARNPGFCCGPLGPHLTSARCRTAPGPGASPAIALSLFVSLRCARSSEGPRSPPRRSRLPVPRDFPGRTASGNCSLFLEILILPSLWKTVWRFLQKLQIELPCDPAIPPLGIYPKEMEIGYQGDVCNPMCIAVFIHSSQQRGNKCPSLDE